MTQKYCVLASDDLADSLKYALKQDSLTVVEDETIADFVLVDEQYDPLHISTEALYPGIYALLDRLYMASMKESQTQTLVFLIHLPESAFQANFKICFPLLEKWTNQWFYLLELGKLNVRTNCPSQPGSVLKPSWNDLKPILQAYPLPKSHPPAQHTPILTEKLKWNTLFIDDEVEHPQAASLSIGRLLGYPDKERWDNFQKHIHAVPLYPTELFSGNKESFSSQLMQHIFENDIDLVLMDICLMPPKEPDSPRYGFHFLDLITRQARVLGKLGLPVVVFTRYTQETSFMIASLQHGARWYTRKENAKSLDADKGRCVLVTELPDIIKNMYGENWLDEYLEHYFPFGENQIKIRNALLKHDSNSCQCEKLLAEFADSRDPFFQDDGFQRIVRKLQEVAQNETQQFCRTLRKSIEYHYLFRILFIDFHGIKKLEKIGSGFSGTDVFYVTPHKNGIEYAEHVVKLGAYPKILQEYHNFEDYINGLLDSFIGRIKRSPVRAYLFAGLIYTAIGTKIDYQGNRKPWSFKKLIGAVLGEHSLDGQNISLNQLKAFIGTLFQKALEPLYSLDGQKKKSCKRISPFIHNFPPLISGTLVAVYCQKGDGLNLIEGKIQIDEDWISIFAQSNDINNCVEISQLQEVSRITNETSYLLLKDFEIYDTDLVHSFQPNIILTNRNGLYRQQLKEQESSKNLDRAWDYTDLTVEVQIRNGNFNTFLSDPRIQRGKQLTLVIEKPKKDNHLLSFLLWERAWTGEWHSISLAFSEKERAYQAVMNNLIIGSFEVLKDCFTQCIQQNIFTGEQDFTFSIIHGDLNVENLLVTSAVEPEGSHLEGWLIDFAHSHKQLTVFDFVKLENEIKLYWFSEYLFKLIQQLILNGEEEEQAIETAFRWFKEFEFYGSVDNEFSMKLKQYEEWKPLCRAAQLIQLFRQQASNRYLLKDYQWCLFFYSLNMLRWTLNEVKIFNPIPKCLLYLSAWIAAQKIPELKELLAKCHHKSRSSPAPESSEIDSTCW